MAKLLDRLECELFSMVYSSVKAQRGDPVIRVTVDTTCAAKITLRQLRDRIKGDDK